MFVFFTRNDIRERRLGEPSQNCMRANSHKAMVAKIVHHLVGARHITIRATPCLRSQSDAANARAALHAKMEAQRNLQACSALPRRTSGTDLAFARGNLPRKMCVSSDQRPLTSNRAHALGQFSACLPASCHCESRSIDLCCTSAKEW